MAHDASGGFTDVELAAIKERAAELRAENGGKKAAAAMDDLLKSIRAMPPDQRVIAERIHVIVTEVAPDLRPRLGMDNQPGRTPKERSWCSSTLPPSTAPDTTPWGLRRRLTSMRGSCGRRPTRSPAPSE